MKFESKERKLVSSQKTMAIELGLADQKKAIELLYSQYRKPIQTCVQELVCNAFDAMQDAGKSHVPIKVQLPNDLNDFYFSVRDYGNSMDDDAIKNVYMRVNASTKSKSNKAIGGFGIGSKTPWAYTDTFILKTFLNGLETQYALVKGMSSVQVVYRGETKEENGTEVVFKTKPRDKDNFEKALVRVSLCAKTKPLVNAKLNLSFESELKINNLVSFVDYFSPRDSIILNIGGVIYSLDFSFLSNDKKPWRNKTDLQKLYHYARKSIMLTLPIGSIKPLQTREDIFTGGKEGQENRSMLKPIVKYALKSVENYIEKETKKVIDVKTACEFFKSDLIRYDSRFKFGKININNYSIFLNESKMFRLSRKPRSYRGGSLKKAKKLESNILEFSDLKGKIYFNELSPNKARLCSRFHNHCVNDDVIILNKESMEIETYEILKEITNAVNINTVEIPKVIRTTTTRNTDEVIVYTIGGDRRFSWNIKDKPSKYGIVIHNRDKSLGYSCSLLKMLGIEVWFVAPTNVKKFDNLLGYRTLEEAIDWCAIKELYVNDVASDLLYKLKRENLTYVLPFLTESKRKLHIKIDKRYGFSSYGPDSMTVKKLYETFGSSIDKEIKSLVKKRVRLCNIVDTMPLLSYVNVMNLSQVAKKDLNDYINQRIGA